MFRTDKRSPVTIVHFRYGDVSASQQMVVKGHPSLTKEEVANKVVEGKSSKYGAEYAKFIEKTLVYYTEQTYLLEQR